LVHPAWLVLVVILGAWVTAFLSGTGLLFSALMRRTTPAVVLNLALSVTLWMLLPFVVGMVASLARSPSEGVRELLIWSNPVWQAGTIGEGTGGDSHASMSLSRLEFGTWRNEMGFGDMIGSLGRAGACYTVVGLLMVWLSSRRVRKRVF